MRRSTILKSTAIRPFLCREVAPVQSLLFGTAYSTAARPQSVYSPARRPCRSGQAMSSRVPVHSLRRIRSSRQGCAQTPREPARNSLREASFPLFNDSWLSSRIRQSLLMNSRKYSMPVIGLLAHNLNSTKHLRNNLQQAIATDFITRYCRSVSI